MHRRHAGDHGAGLPIRRRTRCGSRQNPQRSLELVFVMVEALNLERRQLRKAG